MEEGNCGGACTSWIAEQQKEKEQEKKKKNFVFILRTLLYTASHKLNWSSKSSSWELEITQRLSINVSSTWSYLFVYLFTTSRYVVSAMCLLKLNFPKCISRVFLLFFSVLARQPLWARSSSLPRFQDHTPGADSVGPLRTSVRPVAGTSSWQHTTLERERHPCAQQDSNTQPQQASGRRPTP
jgi:hypothetical protein